jgi:hypothetical protein
VTDDGDVNDDTVSDDDVSGGVSDHDVDDHDVGDHDVTDATPAPARGGFLGRLAPKPTAPMSDNELRQSMRTLDPLERKIGWVVGALPLLLALILSPDVLHNTPGTAIKVLKKGQHCPVKLTGTTCVVSVTNHPSQYALQFSFFVAIGLIILFGVWRSKRVLVAVASLFAGLGTGVTGILSIFYGGWLLLRSWRLQRYGVSDGASVRAIAVERSKERRENRGAPRTPRTSRKASTTATTAGPKPPQSSKRYTPKAQPRKR